MNKNKIERDPDFIIIGAMNSGTTSLHYYLSLHPEIFMSTPKELDFFNIHYDKGLEFYRSFFNSNEKMCGETSPNYTKNRSDLVAQRIYQNFPSVKIIYIVRDPVERFLSQCRFHDWDPNKTCREIFSGNKIEYDLLISGKYATHYQRFLQYFGQNQLLIVTTEQLLEDRKHTLKIIFRFLNVSTSNFDFSKTSLKSNNLKEKKIPSKLLLFLNGSAIYRFGRNQFSKIALLNKVFHHIMYSKQRNVDVEPRWRNALHSYYHDEVQLFEKLTGIRFKSW